MKFTALSNAKIRDLHRFEVVILADLVTKCLSVELHPKTKKKKKKEKVKLNSIY